MSTRTWRSAGHHLMAHVGLKTAIEVLKAIKIPEQRPPKPPKTA